MPDFFQTAPDPAADPQAFAQQRAMAQMLMKGAGQNQQGSMVGGNYVPPSTGQYVNQLAQGLAGGYQNQQLQGAQRASAILNGGTAPVTPMARFQGIFGGG